VGKTKELGNYYMKKNVVKILNVVVTVLIVLVLIASAFVLVCTFTSREEGDGVPNFFGKAPINVLTDSMKGDGELNFDKGDLILCEVVSPDNRVDAKYSEGDVVTFQQDADGDGYNDYVTHRIYKINKDGTYQTKGDNNDTYDQDPKGTTVFSNIQSADVVAVYKGSKIDGIGNFIGYIRSQEGFFLVVLLPMIIFFLYTAVRVVMNAMAYSKEKGFAKAQEAIANADLTDEQKQKAIAEYLAAQQGEQAPEQSPAEAPETIEKQPEEPTESEDA
jgi:signal peptidase I